MLMLLPLLFFFSVPPVLGVYNSCPGCLPDPNGGDAPTFSYTNCIYFNNDKFWTSLDVIAQGAKNNNTRYCMCLMRRVDDWWCSSMSRVVIHSFPNPLIASHALFTH